MRYVNVKAKQVQIESENEQEVSNERDSNETKK